MNPFTRLEKRAIAWGVAISHILDTEGSLIGFGSRRGQGVVLKVVKGPGDEWTSGEIVRAFDGRGTVRVLDEIEGALLLERLSPGHSLVSMVLEGRDDAAVDAISDVIGQMRGRTPPQACATLEDWGRAFGRYLRGGDRHVPLGLVEEAHQCFARLVQSQQQQTLLHGDLHHYNVLFDATRGWVSIDPKGVVGEPEYEIGAVLRNPIERPDLFLPASTVERRVNRFSRQLNLDIGRTIRWAFAQSVLSAIWSVEDGHVVDPSNPGLRLAGVLRAMLSSGS